MNDDYIIQWVKQDPSWNTTTSESKPSISLDNNGNVYFAYTTLGNVNGDGDVYVAFPTVNGDGNSNIGYSDIVVTKVDNTGVIQWIKQDPSWNTIISDTEPSIVVDNNGNIYFIYIVVSEDTYSNPIYNNVIVKLDNSGSFQWTKLDLPLNVYSYENKPSIAIDNDGNIYITYDTIATIDNDGNITYINNGSSNIFVVKLNSSGVVQWVKQNLYLESYGSDTSISLEVNNTSPSIAVDNDGNLYIAYINSGSGSYNIILTKLNSSGDIQWVKQDAIWNTAGTEYSPSITLDNDGDIYFVYRTNGTVPGDGNTHSGGHDIVVTKVNSSGDIIWIKQDARWNTINDEYSPSIAVDNNKNVYFAYTTNGTIAGDGNSNSGGYDIVVTKLDSSGVIQWVEQNFRWNTNETESNPSIAVDNDGNIYFSYSTTGTIEGYSNNSISDIVVTKLKRIPFTLTGTTSLNPGNTELTIDISGAISNVLYEISGTDISGVIDVSNGVGTLTGINVSQLYGIYNIILSYYNNEINFITKNYKVIQTPKINNNFIYTEWIKQDISFNTTEEERKPSMDVDGSGNIYIAYRTLGQVSGDGNLKSGNRDIAITKINSSGVVQWSRQDPSWNTSDFDYLPAISVDNNGNVFFSYHTEGIISNNIGSYDVVLGKINSSGELLWIKQDPSLNTTQEELYTSLASDNNGNVYLAYNTQDAVIGDSKGFRDIVITKVDSEGVIQWIKQDPLWNTTGNDEFASIATDNNGNVYLASHVSRTVPGGTTAGIFDIVITMLDSSGVIQWVKQDPSWNTSESDLYPSIAVDNNGNVYFAYSTTGLAPGDGNIISAGRDIVVAKIDNSGIIQWVRQDPKWNTNGTDSEPSIATDNNGNVYLAYHTDGELSGDLNSNIGGNDIVIVKLNSSGKLIWSKQDPSWNTSTNDGLPSIVVDNNGNIYFSYETTSYVEGYTNSGSTDIVVTKLKMIPSNLSGTATLNTKNTELTINVFSPGRSISYEISGTDISGIINVSDGVGILSGINIIGLNGKYEIILNDINTNETITLTTDSINNYNILSGSTSLNMGHTRLTIDISGANSNILYEISGTNISGIINVSNGIGTLKDIDVNGLHGIYEVILTDQNGDETIILTTDSINNNFTINTDWVRQLSSWNTTGIESEPSLAVDNDGNVYFAYQTTGLVPGNSNSSSGNSDIVVAKLNSLGVIQWVKQDPSWNTFGSDTSPSITVDNNGNVYFTYKTNDTIQDDNNSSSENSVIVVTKLDSSGIIQWIKKDPILNTLDNDYYPKIQIDSIGNIYLAYLTLGTVSGDGNSNKGSNDIVVAKLDSSGIIQWVKQDPSWNTIENDFSLSLTVGNNGNLYFAYQTIGSVSGQSNLNPGSRDIVITKLDSSGVIQWVKQDPSWNTTENDISPSIVVDNEDNVYFTYNTYGSVTGDSNSIQGNYNIVLTKLNSSGTIQWVKQEPIWNTYSDNYNTSIAVDNDGNVYFAYQTLGTVEGDGNSSSGGSDIAVTKVDSFGSVQWVKQDTKWNTPTSDSSPSIAVDDDGNVYFAYQTLGTVEGDGNTSSGENDIVIVKLKNIYIPSGLILLNKENTELTIIVSFNKDVLYKIQGTDISGIINISNTNGVLSGVNVRGLHGIYEVVLNDIDDYETLILDTPFINKNIQNNASEENISKSHLNISNIITDLSANTFTLGQNEIFRWSKLINFF